MKSLSAAWQARPLSARAAVALLTLSYLTQLSRATLSENLPTLERVLNFCVLTAILGLAVWGVAQRTRFVWRALLVYAVVMLIEYAVATTEGGGVVDALQAVMYLALLVTLTRPDLIVRAAKPSLPSTSDPDAETSPVNQVRRGVGTALIVLSFVVFGVALRWVGKEQEANMSNPDILGELWVGVSTIVAMLYVLPISIAIALIGVYLRKQK